MKIVIEKKEKLNAQQKLLVLITVLKKRKDKTVKIELPQYSSPSKSSMSELGMFLY